MKEKTISSEYLYKGKILNLRKDTIEVPDSNGKVALREIVEHRGAVAIVAISNDGKILLERQYRKPVEDILIEIPAGKLEIDEEPSECAKRELEEETGFIPGEIILLNTIYTSPGFCNKKIYIYLARKLKNGKIHFDDDERIDVFYADYNEAINMIHNGSIKDGKTIAGIMMAKQFL